MFFLQMLIFAGLLFFLVALVAGIMIYDNRQMAQGVDTPEPEALSEPETMTVRPQPGSGTPQAIRVRA